MDIFKQFINPVYLWIIGILFVIIIWMLVKIYKLRRSIRQRDKILILNELALGTIETDITKIKDGIIRYYKTGAYMEEFMKAATEFLVKKYTELAIDPNERMRVISEDYELSRESTELTTIVNSALARNEVHEKFRDAFVKRVDIVMSENKPQTAKEFWEFLTTTKAFREFDVCFKETGKIHALNELQKKVA